MKISKSMNERFNGAEKSMETKSNPIFYARILAVVVASVSSTSFATQGTDYIEPAKYQTLDKYNVNMAGNQLSPTIETVAIGGELGLKHSISPMGNHFDQANTNDAYRDKYSGGLRTTVLGKNISVWNNQFVSEATAMRASFLGQQAQFLVIRNDGTYQPGYYSGTDYYYESLGDKRHTLKRRTDGLVWTQPDGTEVFFSTADETATARATATQNVKKIVYPNGFTIEVGSNYGVITNTGFALKYDFDSTDLGLDSSKQGRVFPSGSTVPQDSVGARLAFRDANPKYITAINTAIDPCKISWVTSCSSTLTKQWPKATLTWPGGMPRAIYIDKTTFSVTNAAGGRTDLIYEAQDAGRKDDGTIPNDQFYTPGKLISPRLVEIISAGATKSSVTYSYKNEKPREIIISNPNYTDTFLQYDWDLLPGTLTSATGILGAESYDTGDLGQGSPSGVIVYGKSYGGYTNDFIVWQYTTPPVGILDKIIDNKGDRTIYFELDYRNFVSRETFGKGPAKVYHYDARGNIDSITQGTAVAQASYPTSCANPKTCNKPEWVKDPNGNQTDYTYHSSGQIQTVTFPADKRGIRAQTRYEYEQLKAAYYNADGVLANEADIPPIWLKTAEKYCTNSTYSGSLDATGKFSGNCGTGDQEVVTRYEYNSKNLLLTAQVVEADGKTFRTCFQYDIYGNQIGKTEPKAELSACPQ